MAKALKRRSPLAITFVIAVLLLLGFGLFAAIWGERLWFKAIDYQTVFRTQFWVTIGLFLFSAVLVAALIAINMVIAYRLRNKQRATTKSELLEKYYQILDKRFWLMVLVPSVILGIFSGLASLGQVLPVLAWLNAEPFGVTDSRFGLDISFYVFGYPVFRFFVELVLQGLLFGTLGALATHFISGKLFSKTRQAAHAQILVNFGILSWIFALHLAIAKYGLMFAKGTLFTGLHYTNDHANVHAYQTMTVVAVIVGVIFILAGIFNRAQIAVASLALMVVTGVILGLIAPAVIQAFDVRPEEPDKERPYIEAHIKATRQAYGVDAVEIKDYAAVTQVRPGQLKQDAAALPGIRLMDPSVVGPAFEQFQQVRGYYSFPANLDIDRYEINGTKTDSVVAAREIDIDGVADKNWNNIHTVYTHGFGLVAAYGNKRQPGGEPEWIEKNIPPVGALNEHEPRIYYGERSNNFAVVGREEGMPAVELDTPGSSQEGGEKTNVYQGKGGVPIGNLFNRLVYSVKLSDLNLLLSDRVTSVSKLLLYRTPKERVEKVAPWLKTDSDPYPIVADGRVKWVVDGYTTSDSYPNSQRTSLRNATTDTRTKAVGAQDDLSINYIRNSVKAIVDAYDGSVELYAWDESDPILKTYAKVFPNTVKPKSEIPKEVLSHLRYPTDLFKVQREILARYHMTNPNQFYSQSDLWQVPPDPAGGDKAASEPPYYLSIKWPGDEHPVFSLTTVYTPNLRQNLASYMAVNADATSKDYGKIRILRMSDNQQIDGPGQTFNAINTNQLVAEKLRPFLNQGSAAAEYGNLLTLPMGNGLLYVEPIYTKRQGASGSYPILKFVTVRFGEHIGIGETLQEALDMCFAGDAGSDTGEEIGAPDPDNKVVEGQKPGTATSEPAASVAESPSVASASTASSGFDQAKVLAAIEKAKSAFAAADAALKNGDLGTYQKKNAEAEAALAEAYAAAGKK